MSLGHTLRFIIVFYNITTIPNNYSKITITTTITIITTLAQNNLESVLNQSCLSKIKIGFHVEMKPVTESFLS